MAKVGWNVGRFRAMLVLIETVGDGPDGTRFKQRTEERSECTMLTVFEVEKEIPARMAAQ